MPTLTTVSIRFDEQQLLDLAAKARVQGEKRGYLHKADMKLKKLTQRWCCVFHNFLFYFESESCTKPLGVVFLEGCLCRAVDQVGVPIRELQGTFRISSEGVNSKHYFFCARTDKERDDWIEAITSANMTKAHHEHEELRQRCAHLESKLATSMKEIEHLTLANRHVQEDISLLRASVCLASPNRKRRSSSLANSSPTPSSPDRIEEQVKVLQGYVRGWLIRRRWRNVVEQYLKSPSADMMKKRNQLVWKFVASEEDYVSQLMVLNEEFRQQCEIAACSSKPPITLEHCKGVFRNCDELLLFHQLFLRGLHYRIEKWPVVMLGDVLKLFIPMMSIYHQYVGNHTHALDLLLTLQTEPAFKKFLGSLQERVSCKGMIMDDLLMAPLKRIATYIQDLQELRAHVPTEHVDYCILHDTIKELEIIQKTVTDEVSVSESIRAVLKMERQIEGGCDVLLDKEQALVREGILQQVRLDEKTATLSRGGKLRTVPRYCFLFSKHLIVTTRIPKKPYDGYRLSKEHGVLSLAKCHVFEHHSTEWPELNYRAFRVECSHDDGKESVIFMASSISDKAQWMADFSQCVENEKQNKIIHSQSLGEPVELNSKFIRYSTFKTGKEQLVSCGNLDSLLQRLVKVSYFGLDFLNTFLLTFPLYTDAQTVFAFLSKRYYEAIDKRDKGRRGSMNPRDAVRDARMFTSEPVSRSTTVQGTGFLTIPHGNGQITRPPHSRTASETAVSASTSLSGILFALKHWICKHFYHFEENAQLSDELETLLDHACSCPFLTPREKDAAMDVSRLYAMQKTADEDQGPILELMKCQIHLPQKPFEVVLLWEPQAVAEQLSLLENALFSRIANGEILRYFLVKGEEKMRVAPALTAVFDHFNRMSLFFMWSVVQQRYSIDRTKVLEFLIQLGLECVQLNNYSSFMQIMSALEHGSIGKFKTSWDYVTKHLKQQLRTLTRLSSTDGRFKELRAAMRKAHPPSVPYLGIVLNGLSGVVEALPTHIENDLINFSKMRRCTRLITDALQHQRETYEFAFVPEISKILLCTPIPGNEDELYHQVGQIDDK